MLSFPSDPSPPHTPVTPLSLSVVQLKAWPSLSVLEKEFMNESPLCVSMSTLQGLVHNMGLGRARVCFCIEEEKDEPVWGKKQIRAKAYVHFMVIRLKIDGKNLTATMK